MTEDPSKPIPEADPIQDPKGNSPDPSEGKTYTEEQYQRAMNRKLANYIPKTDYQAAIDRASALEKALQENERLKQELSTRLSTFEQKELKAKIAAEIGIPLTMLHRINGIDEKSLREDAETLRKELGIKHDAGKPVPAAQAGQQISENDEMNAALRMLAGVGGASTR
jgi:predicted phage-related endonuclease